MEHMNKARLAEAGRGIIQFETLPIYIGMIESILCASIERAMDNGSKVLKRAWPKGKTLSYRNGTKQRTAPAQAGKPTSVGQKQKALSPRGGVFCIISVVMAEEKRKVGVIRGGTGGFFEASLKEGSEIIFHILEKLSEKFRPVDILIDREGNWHASGLPVDVAEISQKADLFWDTTRSDAYMSLRGLPVANVSGGSSSFPEKSRKMLAEHMKRIGVGVPRHLAFPAYFHDIDGPLEGYARRKAREVFEKFSPPWRVRPFPYARSADVILARNFPELAEAIKKVARGDTGILVDEYISGKSVKMHSVRGFRGKDIYIFPPAGPFTVPEKELLLSFSKDLHEYIGGSDYVSADAVLASKKKVYLTDLEFSPNLEEGSSFTAVCRSVGAEPHHVIGHILEQTLDGQTHNGL